jgi:hypothetical protein
MSRRATTLAFMNTTNYEWLKGLHARDTRVPETRVDGEVVYTLYMRDLLKMPDVNFDCLSRMDASLKSLFN